MPAPLLALITVFAALSAAIYFIVEDIRAFNSGQESLIGNILNRWPVVMDFFREFIGVIKDAFSWIMKLGESISSIFGGGTKTIKAIQEGQFALSTAGQSPISSQTTNSIRSNAFANKSQTISIGEISVNTQATDADGIAGQIGKSLSAQMSQANSGYDDGVLA